MRWSITNIDVGEDGYIVIFGEYQWRTIMKKERLREEMLKELHGPNNKLVPKTFAKKHSVPVAKVWKMLEELEDVGLCAIE